MGKFVFNDLKREYHYFKKAVDTAVLNVMESGLYISGPQTELLEQNFQKLTGKKHCIAVKNTSDAITITLKKFQIKRCLLPNFGTYSVGISVINAGCEPMFLDVDDTLTIDIPEANSFTYSYHTMAVIGINTFGNKCNFNNLQEARSLRKFLIIEDCSETVDPKHDYSKADINIFSFYMTSPLASMADGGMICLDNDSAAAEIRSHINHGMNNSTGVISSPGVSSRIDEIQAAIVNAKFPYLERGNIRRKFIADSYAKVVPDTFPIFMMLPHGNCTYNQFPILFISNTDRQKFIDKLIIAGIPYKINYKKHMSEMPVFENYIPTPVQHRVNDTILSLPCNAQMSDAEVAQVVSFLENYKK